MKNAKGEDVSGNDFTVQMKNGDVKAVDLAPTLLNDLTFLQVEKFEPDQSLDRTVSFLAVNNNESYNIHFQKDGSYSLGSSRGTDTQFKANDAYIEGFNRKYGTHYSGDDDVTITYSRFDEQNAIHSVSVSDNALVYPEDDSKQVYYAENGGTERKSVVETDDGLAVLHINCPTPDGSGSGLANYLKEAVDLKAMDGSDLPDPTMAEALKLEAATLAKYGQKLEDAGHDGIPQDEKNPSSCGLPVDTVKALDLNR